VHYGGFQMNKGRRILLSYGAQPRCLYTPLKTAVSKVSVE